MPFELILAIIAACLAVLSIFVDRHQHTALAVAVLLLAAIHVLP